METRYFNTLIKHDHKFGENKFVRGVITGIRYALLHYDKKIELSNVLMEDTGNVIIPAVCTAEEYEKFKTLVEERYPGLCEFDVEFDFKRK